MSSSLPIIHASDRFVVIDKPSMMLSVPGRGEHKQDCVAARVRTKFPTATGPLTVHRLDYETSGLMVFALDEEAHRLLSRQFEQRKVRKAYVAILEGRLEQDEGEVSLPLRADIDQWPRPVHIVDHVHGREAITRWRVLARETLRRDKFPFDPIAVPAMSGAPGVQFPPEASWPADEVEVTRVRFEPLTGRSHQLRVHSASGLSAPIIGDPLYGGLPASRLMLHASELEFQPPGDSASRAFISAAPF
ncbi:MAG: hypothetical protein AMXMBFR58_21380 [Phycisphaerae bacterium]